MCIQTHSKTIHARIDKGIVKLDRRISSLRGSTTASTSSFSFRASSSKPTANKAGRKHNLFTPSPKDPDCEECRRTTVTRASCKRNPDDRAHRISIAKSFGDMITADHKVLNDDQDCRLHHKYAVVVQHLATQWIQSFPCKDRISSRDAKKSQKILSSGRKLKIHFLTILWNLSKLSKLPWNHERSRRTDRNERN